MIRFNCDYSEGAHARILAKLTATNYEQTAGYGDDPYCENAKKLIKRQLNNEDCDIYFLVGGTQVNFTVIASALRPHQCVLSADTGHINVHETGAVEATGHKIIPLPSRHAKVCADDVEKAFHEHFSSPIKEHLSQPKMLYISHPTESGSLYTKDELRKLKEICRTYGAYLYLDGARLGYGLAAEGTDVTLPDLAELCDAFYIGGTKVGALFGEAVVLCHPDLRHEFRYHIKLRGALLAKGRLLGIQFETLFEDGLYFELGKHADTLAARIRDAFAQKGFPFLAPSATNQQFPILPHALCDKLAEKYEFEVWEPVDDGHSAVRFCTSWATRPEDVDALVQDILCLA